VDLLDVLRDPGRIGSALQEGGPDFGALDAALDVSDEEVRHLIDAAVLEVVREVVVAVDAGAGGDLDTGLLRDLRHEAHVAAGEHRGRVADRLDAAVGRRAHRLERGRELGVLVVCAGPLRRGGLVADAQVLVDQHRAEVPRVDRAPNRLDSRHRLSSRRDGSGKI
jgi:hypothetical protein